MSFVNLLRLQNLTNSDEEEEFEVEENNEESKSLDFVLTEICANSALFLQTSVFEMEKQDLEDIIDYVAVLYKKQKELNKSNLNNNKVKNGKEKVKYIETEATWY